MVKLTQVNARLSNKYYDLTIIIDKEDNAILIDNPSVDYKDFVDCNTLIVKHIKLAI